MGKIVLLDDLTINKIAAGEVIERPASAIKELVENSIDAGATNISVEVKNGGISYIRITDNGCGISEDDMEISFERHATSKIRKAEDLDTVKSMGFRGEALASIAAIANVEMTSRTADSEVGHKIVVEGGKVLEFTEVGAPIGTTIIVRNLFFNTPVRYKFLKKDYTESGYIEDVITRLALVNKDVAIKYINTGKTIIQTAGNGDSKSTIYSIYRKDIANGIIDINYEYEGIKVTGVIGKPEIARSNRSNQIFFVNKRNVRDKSLTAAAEQAYKGMLPIGKFGFIILNLDMDATKVDVNVHPAKLEVRFEEESKVFKAVYNAIKDGLLKKELVANVERPIIFQRENFENSIKPEIKEEKEESKGFAGLFKKMHKDQNESDEDKNNTLKEIYEFRNELKKIGVSPVSTVPVSTVPVTVPTESKVEKEETKIDDIEVDENFIKQTNEKTKSIIESYYNKVYNLQKPVEKPSTENQESVTETVNTEIKENNENQVINEKIEEKTNDVIENSNEIIENRIENINNEVVEEKVETENINNEIEFADNSEEMVDNVTEKLMQEIKDSDEERTQVIDTQTVRKALEEMKKPENSDKNFDEMYTKIFGKSPVQETVEEKKDDAPKFEFSADDENITVFENSEDYATKPLEYRFIGIAFSTYIIIEIKDEMYIIDQHAAHERIMYEKVKKNYFSDEDKDSQMLLIPDVITLSHKEADIIKQNIGMFEKAGFTVEEFGENTVKLTGVPNICIDLNTKQLFLDLLDEIDTVAVTARQEIEEKFLSTIACKSAVKAKMKLTEEEVHKLMEVLLKLPNPFTCPHGRPTAIKMTKADLEKKFSRRK